MSHFGDDLREQLAAIEHERWADWQRYLHGLCERRPDGSLVIPADSVERWEQQIATPYADLSEPEKQSDRDQVDRYWPLIDAELQRLRLAHTTVSVALDESGRYSRWAETELERLRGELAAAKTELDAIQKNRLIAAIFGHHPGAAKPFALYRHRDETGVSGTGIVAEGAEFSDGMVVLRWRSEFPTSVVFHERGIESVEAVHGHGGKTQIVWLSDELEPLSAMEQERDGLRDRIAEVLTWCDDASQVSGQVGYVRADALREIFADSQPAPTNSPTWELDPDREEQQAKRLDGRLADIEARVAAERAVIDAAKAFRAVAPPGWRSLNPVVGRLIAAVDAHNALGTTPDTAAESADDEAVHAWFELTYSNFLVLPRSLMQSMPSEWQRRIVACLQELREAFAHLEHPQYKVDTGKWCYFDDLGDTDRKRLGITSGCDDEPDDSCDPPGHECEYFDAEGNEVDRHTASFFLPCPIPHYNRGRTHVPRADELAAAPSVVDGQPDTRQETAA